jgi:hypothetical protein
MALPFLRSDTEEEATQTIAFVGIAIMTAGLCFMNVTGAIAGSEGLGVGQVIIRGALAVILAGAELLAAVALVRVMLAPNLLRKWVGGIIFVGLAWACIQNGKRAVHLIYPEFRESAALLEAKAQIAANDADQMAQAKRAAIGATPAELEKVRTDIAKLQAEQQLMASQSPEKIMEAQALLIAQGKYRGEVDGIRKELTEAAMRSRGEEIGHEMEVLKAREANLSGGIVQVAPVLRQAGTNADTAALKRVELEEAARKAKSATIWLEIMLWVFEGARSFGLWALVAQITNANRKKGGEDEEREKAWQEYLNRREGDKKGKRTRRIGKKIEQSRDLARERIAEFMTMKQQGMSIDDIAAKRGMTRSQLKVQYENDMTQEEYDYLFNPRAVAIIDPKPEPDATDSDEADQQSDDTDNQDEDEADPRVAAE